MNFVISTAPPVGRVQDSMTVWSLPQRACDPKLNMGWGNISLLLIPSFFQLEIDCCAMHAANGRPTF